MKIDQLSATQALRRMNEISVSLLQLSRELQASNFSNLDWNNFRKEDDFLEQAQSRISDIITYKFIDSQS